jgi:hypothetical protein
MKSSKRMEGKRLCQGQGDRPVTGFGARLDVCEWILRDEFVQESDLVDAGVNCTLVRRTFLIEPSRSPSRGGR